MLQAGLVQKGCRVFEIFPGVTLDVPGSVYGWVTLLIFVDRTQSIIAAATYQLQLILQQLPQKNLLQYNDVNH